MKFIKEVFVFDYEMVINGEVDMTVTVNEDDLMDMSVETGWAMMDALGLIKNDQFIIPIGTKILYMIDQGGG